MNLSSASIAVSPFLSIRKGRRGTIAHPVSVPNMWMMRVLEIGHLDVMEKCSR